MKKLRLHCRLFPGAWKVYKDGAVARSGSGLSTNRPIPGGGQFVLGQKFADGADEFFAQETFIGRLHDMRLWNVPNKCLTNQESANLVKAWPDFLGKFHGKAVRKTSAEKCPRKSK